MSRLWVFNPGHEEALRIPAHLRYTPTAEVRQIRHDLAPLLCLLAQEGDYIYRPARSLGEPPELLDHRGGAIAPESLRGQRLEVVPWGLEPHILRELCETPILRGIELIHPCITPAYLRMAHRRGAYGLLAYLSKQGGYPEELLPHWVEAHETREETRHALEQTLSSAASRGVGSLDELLIKRPFSSSGRGVLPIPKCYTERHLETLTGSCHRLGSISIEPLWMVREDWALEYERTADGQVSLVALSLFETQPSGRSYAGNLLLSQSELRRRLTNHIGEQALTQLIHLHTQYLTEALAESKYVGYIGIDLFLYEDGEGLHLHPCVEINLRTTMGLIAHLAYEQILVPEGAGRFLVEYTPSPPFPRVEEGDFLLTFSEERATFRAVVRRTE